MTERRQTEQQQQLFQLRSIKTSIKQQEETTQIRQKRRKAKEEAQKAQPRRLGKLKYKPNMFFYTLILKCSRVLTTFIQSEVQNGFNCDDRFSFFLKFISLFL